MLTISPIATAQRIPSPLILAKSAIPFIGLSSGSVDANGVISAITALPQAYPNAYCYFPANALATSIAAGWHYCTFSTTTAGVAFLNTYTSGAPSIPSSPTAVTDGKGAFTGDTGEEFGPTITVLANAMGASGQILIQLATTETNNANAKTPRVRFNGNAGTDYCNQSAASVTDISAFITIANKGRTDRQTGGNKWINAGGSSAWVRQVSSIDTTANVNIVFSIQRATATDNLVIDNFMIQLLSDGT